MQDPKVTAGLLRGKLSNLATPARRLFQLSDGSIVSLPAHYLYHPGYDGQLTPWPEGFGARTFGYPSATNFPGADNYPGTVTN